MADTIRYIEAGKRLRELREKKLLTQRDVERLTLDRYGLSERVQSQMVSRIEKGNFDKPPIEALLKVGQVYGLTPDHIAEMYGLWRSGEPIEPPETPAEPTEPRLKRALREIPTLPEDLREDVLSWLDFALIQAQAKVRARAKEREVVEV